MTFFTSLTHHARLGLACVAVLGLFVMAAPAAQATIISETWDNGTGAGIVTDTGGTGTGGGTGWPSQWEYVNSSNAVFSIQSNEGDIHNASAGGGRNAKALIKSSVGTFSDSALSVDVRMYNTTSVGSALLARYTTNISGQESYYAASFIRTGDGYQASIIRTIDDASTTLVDSAFLGYTVPIDFSHLTFYVQDTLSGDVQLNMTLTNDIYPSVISLSAIDTTPVTGAGQVGVMGYLNSNGSRYVKFDNFLAVPTPEPASLTLLGLGGLVMLAAGRRRR